MALQAQRDGKQILKTGMPPPAPPKRVAHKRVLDEDAYIAGLEKIIRRDFYPDLDKYEAKLELLDAMQRGDTAAVQRLKSALTPTPSSSRASTPLTPLQRVGGASTPSRGSKEEVDTAEQADNIITERGDEVGVAGVSLKEYVANFTSEDNASFQTVISEENAKKKSRNAWMYDAEKKHNEHQAAIALPKPDEVLRLEGPRASVKTWEYRTKNELMYYPQGVAVDAQAKEAFESRQTVAANTRVSDSFLRDQEEATRRATEVDGGPSNWREKEGQKYDLDKMKATPARNAGVAESPRVGGFGFVATPSPVPGLQGESPQMTWGTIDGTPMLLPSEEAAIFGGLSGGGPAHAPVFTMQDQTRREEIALNLSDKVRKKRKEEAKRSKEASTPMSILRRHTSPSQQLRMMSPAAQKMAKRMGVRGNSSSILKSSQSPAIGKSPHLKSGSSSSQRTPVGSRVKTPVVGGASLTDGLLKSM
eukprot:CAMPEP_0113882082 /NCGR_PEP_ID=MMETSP0780_2-20120614/8741_1 /TAXON_ID=652834 /ORGANISM="Palpitomonas bilix" /LENGTH=475 /DNA_ID=CAMNT_0000869025 /DNA_START=51 /DNA_END=1478 /DNA_ORIENTATION=- /assembly_acc=CAM_ASM_000599